MGQCGVCCGAMGPECMNIVTVAGCKSSTRPDCLEAFVFWCCLSVFWFCSLNFFLAPNIAFCHVQDDAFLKGIVWLVQPALRGLMVQALKGTQSDVVWHLFFFSNHCRCVLLSKTGSTAYPIPCPVTRDGHSVVVIPPVPLKC